MSSVRLPIGRWGHDHWSTLAYIEGRCVDHRGVLKNANLRTNTSRHPLFIARGFGSPGDGSQYPTEYRDGGQLTDHDDWDCLYDMVQLGLLTIVKPKDDELWNVPPGERGSIRYRGRMQTKALEVKVKLTDLGCQVAGELRTHLTKSRNYRAFSPSFALAVASERSQDDVGADGDSAGDGVPGAAGGAVDGGGTG